MIRYLITCLTILTLLLSVCFTVSGEQPGSGKLPIDLSGGVPLTQKFDIDLKVYEDPTIRVERDKVFSPEWQCTYYPAFITIKDASQLRTLPAGESFQSRTLTPATQMARRVNAVLAINGDYYAANDSRKANSYILRQGVVYRDTVQTELDMLLIDEDGDFHILKAGPALAETDKTVIDGKKVINAFQFGPALVIDGEKVDDEYINDPSHSPPFAEPEQRNQRMCIGQIDSLNYICVTCAFHGIPLTKLRDLVLSLAPVKNLYVLDGGESSQMVFLGTKINNVKEGGQNVRNVSDIIYFASAWDPSGAAVITVGK